jgi:hypothetical protein
MFNKREGRVTVNDEGKVIGTGGNDYGDTVKVENQKNERIGTTTWDQVKSAYDNQKPLQYKKK